MREKASELNDVAGNAMLNPNDTQMQEQLQNNIQRAIHLAESLVLCFCLLLLLLFFVFVVVGFI